jgi:hypothetical protein
MTAADLITLSLKDLGQVSGDETPETLELTDAFSTLNHIIASWSNDGLVVPEVKHDAFAFTASDPSYTMGPAGDWVTTTRPMAIVGAESSSGTFRRGMEVLPMAQFRKRVQNGTGITAALPDTLGYDNARPKINVRVFPTPNATSAIEIDYWIALAAIATTATVLDLAEGWELALRDELVIRLAPMYGLEATQTQVRNAQASRANIAAILASTMAPAAPAE